jgi:hypothetical protein
MTRHSLRRRLCAVIGASVLAASSGSAAATPIRHGGAERVAGVPATALARARASTVLASPRLRIHIAVALRSRDPAALAAEVRAVSTPGARDYGRYLTPAQFAARFGAPARRIRTVRAALRVRGLNPGPTSTGGLSIPVTATVAALSRGLDTSLARVGVGHAGTRLTATRAPALPRAAAGAVQAVIGLDTAAHPHGLAVRRAPVTDTATTMITPDTAATGAPSAGPQPCATVIADAAPLHAYTDAQIASAYGFGGLYRAGDEGAGTTVAVYELEPDDPADIGAFQACYGTHAQISYIHVDGGAGAGAGSDEAAFDIENLIGFAPRVHVLVYQAPNADSDVPGSGPYDLFSAIINQDRARVVTVSWGECESALGRAAAQAEHVLFEQAAVEGQTLVAAAGDSGAEDCVSAGAPDSSLAVDDPGSQPDVLSVGGTTLASLGPPPVETAWNSAVGAAPGTVSAGAGGGGVSAFWPMGIDQRDARSSLGVRHLIGAAAACDRSSGLCREVPDVSADADPATGYEIYWNGADTVAEPSGWQDLGGTSGAAPVWAALIALADASPACGSVVVGDAGPALYAAADAHYGADFHDVRRGETDFTSTHHGLWVAGVGYDLATGLGTPEATRLVGALCRNSISLTAPGAQSSAAGAGIALRVHARLRRGGMVRYSASHLPPGVHISPTTGQLNGRPSRPGVYAVDAVATTRRGVMAGARFTWSIGASPHVVAARLSGRRLLVEIHGGRHAPPMRAIGLHLPDGLRADGSAGIAVRADGRSAHFVARVEGAMVSISLPTPGRNLSILIGPRTLHRRPGAATRLAVAVRAGTTGTSRLTHAITGGGA